MAERQFSVEVGLNAGAASLHNHYQHVPMADMQAMEKTVLGVFVAINQSQTPTDNLPRLPQAVLAANIQETVDKAGTKHPQPIPFFGPVSLTWHDMPQAAAKTMAGMLVQALAPFGKYLMARGS